MTDETKKDWTIMIYMAGDNNLSVDMAYALQQIKDVVKDNNERVNLFVYYDGYSPAIPTLYCDFSDDNPIKYFRSFRIKNKLYEVEPEFDENSAAALSVVNFVDWCVNKVEYKVNETLYYGRKADKYALIFSGHTFGFQNPGLFKDEKSNYFMTMKKINWLLKRITKSKVELELEAKAKQTHENRTWDEKKIKVATTKIIGEKLDILGFDSCVMSMLEVGYQFNSVARTMVASEGSIPNAGWTYAQILKNITSNSANNDINKVAKSFVEEFINRQNSYTLSGVSVDMAAWDLNVLYQLEAPFKNLVDCLLWCFEEPDSTIYKQMRRVLLQVHWKCQSYMVDQNVDLGDLCKLLIEEITSLEEEFEGRSFPVLETLRGCSEKVLYQLENCIILSGFSGGQYQYSNGISLFFPWTLASYEVSRESYEKLNFIYQTEAGKSWNKFLHKYLNEISFRKAKQLNDQPGEGRVYLSYVYNDDLTPEELAKLSLAKPGDIIDLTDSFATSIKDDTTKTSDDPNVKTPDDPNVRTPDDPNVRTPDDPNVRTPDDPNVRLFGGLGIIFGEYNNFKNVETLWNLSGFTKPTDSPIRPANPIITPMLTP